MEQNNINASTPNNNDKPHDINVPKANDKVKFDFKKLLQTPLSELSLWGIVGAFIVLVWSIAGAAIINEYTYPQSLITAVHVIGLIIGLTFAAFGVFALVLMLRNDKVRYTDVDWNCFALGSALAVLSVLSWFPVAGIILSLLTIAAFVTYLFARHYGWSFLKTSKTAK